MATTFDWGLLRQSVPLAIDGVRITIAATAAGFCFALVGGLILHLLRSSHLRLVARSTGFIIDFIRSTPLLIQLYFLFFGAPLIGLSLSAFTTGVVAIGLHESCYAAEIYRAGLTAIPGGQWDAAAALNLSKRQTYTYVILPLALRPVIPAFGNLLISLFKTTPILSTIGVAEIMYHATKIGAEKFEYTEVMLSLGALFLVLSIAASLGVRVVESKLHHW
jgi:polar amino acid transport system permease protein